LKNTYVKIGFVEIFRKLNSVPKDKYKETLQGIVDNFTDRSVLWKYYIVKNSVLLNSDASNSKTVKSYGAKYYLFKDTNATDNRILLHNYRNELVTDLLKKNKELILENNNDWNVKVDNNTGTTFYRGEHIWMYIPIEQYKLCIQFSSDSVLFGFRKDQVNYLTIKEHYFKFNENWLLYRESERYPDNKQDFEVWLENLIDGINEIKEYAMVKQTTEVVV